ncbi:YcaO-like family protein [Desulfovibrio aminophilus]|nr:YcaO-like family protein [Desulfovibrio aminophilus]MCM0756343.1 YcaO-like family protein [Desulfovibrio aminophilus]
MRYELRLMDNVAGVGCFMAHPAQNLSFNDMLDYLREHPLDDFMHQFLLQGMSGHRTRKLEKLIDEVTTGERKGDLVLAALLRETCLAHERFAHLLPRLEGLDPRELAAHTPLIHIRSSLVPDQDLHRQWVRLFQANLAVHAPLPAPDEAGLAMPFAPEDLPAGPAVTAARTRDRLRAEGRLPGPRERRTLEETIALASERLEKVGCILTREMAHKASLSPFSLLRSWLARFRADNGRQDVQFQGMQTAYGRGLSMEAARASYLMEMCERYSSYASFDASGIRGYARDYPLVHGSHAEVSARAEALDPNLLRLEAPYTGQKLWWMAAEMADAKGRRPILIPAQLVFLFCNLDEPALFSALGSTGLASGNTLEEARLAGLCEVLERDAEAVRPFDPARCFRLETDDPQVGKLLDDYAACGIAPWILDTTPEFGVPCWKSIVLGRRGDVNKGMGCGLSGRRALVSGMTETPYPFPGPAGSPAPEGLPARRLEDLPEIGTGSPEGDLLVLEETLIANGYPVIHADLTRKDLGIPVARAIVPGLEIVADFDQFSRLSPRLFANYLRMFEGK